jgi:argininosuccinate lyase
MTNQHTAATGRLSRPVAAAAREILFDRETAPPPDPVAAELDLISQVDRAHVVMLVERGIVAAEPAAVLLSAIERLRATRFEPLHGVPAPRGRYLAYESHLVDMLGQDVGGVLHSGRSRNDLNATVVRLRLRAPHERLLAECDALGRALLDRAERWATTTMPAYTHHQPAVPITYGHYLAGVANALVRDVAALWQAGEELDQNPLGAGAVGGTSLPIDPGRTTELLGFAAPLPNSLHAVASRDFVLRLLAASTVLGVLLGRVAHDLQSWTSAEAGLLRLADDVVGSSSMMPQKRNPFLLEHVQGKATAPLGAFTAATGAMLTSRFTNAIAVGSEAVGHVWPALTAITDAVVLLRLVVEGAEPVPARMRAQAVAGQTVATHLAERLVGEGVPFRLAHRQVGEVAKEALESARPFGEVARARFGLPPDAFDPDAVVRHTESGGGPGPHSVRAATREAAEEFDRIRAARGARRLRWDEAAVRLDRAVAGLGTPCFSTEDPL